jgi:hypothetical protein
MNEPRPLERIWHIVELNFREQQATTDRMYKGLEMGLEQYHKMLVLTASVIAFVPALLTQSKVPIDAWFLRRGMTSLFITLTLGVIIQVISKYVSIPMTLLVAQSYRRLAELLGEAEGAAPVGQLGEAIANAFQQFESEQKPKLRWLWASVAVAPIGDLAFYGSFLYGVWCLFRAAYLRS